MTASQIWPTQVTKKSAPVAAEVRLVIRIIQEDKPTPALVAEIVPREHVIPPTTVFQDAWPELM